ncbi:MAG: site-specific integrase [Prosthecobacter sp.]|nr:site-specific integrase [Prosthecobacter sp.]
MAVSKLRLTKNVIDDLDPTLGRQYIYDTVNSALAVLVTSAGTKSFYLVKKHQGVQVRQRIGNVADIPIERARAIASERVSALLTGGGAGRQDERPEPEDSDIQDQPTPAGLQTARESTTATSAQAKGAKRSRKEALPPQEPDEDAITLQLVMEEYLAYAAEHRKPSTQAHYRYEWEHYLKAWAGTRTLASLRRREVTDLHQTLGRKNGHHQANRVLALLRAAINRAIREHELNLHNPAIAITFYRELRRSRRLFIEELPAFFQALEDEPNRSLRDFLLVALFTGARKSNLMHMRWEHLSIERGIWIIPAEESKSNSELPVVLVERVRQILSVRRAQSTGPWVFPGRYPHKPMTNPNVGWIRILERSGLKGLRMHDLRRSLASFQIDTGTPLEVIQRTLGHESKTTTEIYARLAMEPVRLSLEKATEEMVRQRASSSMVGVQVR